MAFKVIRFCIAFAGVATIASCAASYMTDRETAEAQKEAKQQADDFQEQRRSDDVIKAAKSLTVQLKQLPINNDASRTAQITIANDTRDADEGKTLVTCIRPQNSFDVYCGTSSFLDLTAGN